MPRDASTTVFALDTLQRWMQEVVVHPGTVEQAISSAEAEREIPSRRLSEVVLPSDTMTCEERIGIYHGMYLMRMEEALAADYPVLRHHIGDHAFADLVRDYVRAWPSRSYTLNRLGDHLPRFLRDSELPQAHFLADLARLELAMTEVFDERESPVLGGEALSAVPPETWDVARVRPIAALRVLEFEHSVIPHLEAFHQNRPSSEPQRRPSWLAVYRRDYSVLRLELERSEYQLLCSLVSGTPLGVALSHAVSSHESPRLQARIFRWFRTWMAEGLFSVIDIA